MPDLCRVAGDDFPGIFLAVGWILAMEKNSRSKYHGQEIPNSHSGTPPYNT
jgi:hypothetical protein